MTAPKRIQRKRTKGWRMPEGAVYVGRGTKWGNPYPVGGRKEGALTIGPVTPQQCVSAYRALVWDIPPWDDLPFDELRGKVKAFIKDYPAKGGFERLGDRYLMEMKDEFKRMGSAFFM